MEYFDLYTEEGHYLNKVALRGQSLKPGEYFLVVHVWIENSEGKFLIQRRAKKTDPIPHQWAVVSGIPNHQEAPLEAAVRETKEELGLSLSEDELEKRARIVTSHKGYNTITHVYHARKDVALEQLSPDSEEVMDVQFASHADILRMVEEKRFWNYAELLNFAEYFGLLKERN